MAKMGAPEKIDGKQLASLMRMMPTLEDCANFFGCSTSAIEKYIKRHHDVTYSEFRQQKMVKCRFNLIRKAIAKAEKGDNVMMIFCLKNMCGWKDKVEHSGDDDKPIKLAYQVNKTPSRDS